MQENEQMASSEGTSEIQESVSKLIEPISETFESWIVEMNEFDEVQFLDELEVMKESLEPDEIEFFEQQVQIKLEIFRLLADEKKYLLLS